MVPEPAPATAPSTQQFASIDSDSEEHVRTLIAQLDDSDYNVRQKASVQVNSMGAVALPLVQAAVHDPDVSPEAQRRLKLALKYLEPRARHEQSRLDCRAWEARMLHQACATGKHLDHAYDGQVSQAIDLFLTLGRDPFHGPAAPRLATLRAMDQLLANNDDPEPVLACLRRIVADDPDSSDDHPEEHLTAKMAGEHYPAGAEMVARLYWLWGTRRPDAADFERAAALLPALAASNDLPAGELDVIGNSFYEVCLRDDDYTTPTLRAFIKTYAELKPREVGPVLLSARQHLDQAAKFLTDGHDEPATAELQASVQELTKANTIDPSDSRIGLYMIIGLQASHGSADEVELWYRRAIAADPDNWQLASHKLRFLEREGNDAAMLAFGRECLATQNWRGQMPLMLADAHQLLATRKPDPAAYWKQPDVWKDLQTLYEAGLANFPASLRLRSKYTMAACMCEQWDVAAGQFDAMGDRFDLTIFGSREMYDYLHDKTHRRAGAAFPATTRASEQ